MDDVRCPLCCNAGFHDRPGGWRECTHCEVAYDAATIARPPFPRISLGPWQEVVFRAIDGRHTVSDCLAAACLPAGWQATVEAGRAFFSGLWRLGYVLFRI